jgi:hypothetical protein
MANSLTPTPTTNPPRAGLIGDCQLNSRGTKEGHTSVKSLPSSSPSMTQATAATCASHNRCACATSHHEERRALSAVKTQRVAHGSSPLKSPRMTGNSTPAERDGGKFAWNGARTRQRATHKALKDSPLMGPHTWMGKLVACTWKHPRAEWQPVEYSTVPLKLPKISSCIRTANDLHAGG